MNAHVQDRWFAGLISRLMSRLEERLSALLRGLVLALLLVVTLLAPLALPMAAQAAPGICMGPVCGDEITRSAKHHFQLRMKVGDQQGHRERLTVDCRDGHLSPAAGPVERGYVAAVARRACRLAGEAPA